MSKSLTRSFLKALGLTEDQQTSILEQHSAVVDEIKAERDTYKEEADKLPGVQKELDTLKGGEDYKTKWETEHKAFEDYKSQVAKDAETAKVKSAYKQLLIDEKINPKLVDDLVRLADVDKMKLDKDGKLENLDALKTDIGDKFSMYKVKTENRYSKPETPPGVDNGGMDNSIRQMTAKWHEAKYGKVPTSQGKE